MSVLWSCDVARMCNLLNTSLLQPWFPRLFKQTVEFKCLLMVSRLLDCHQSWLKWQLNIAAGQIESCLSIAHTKHFSNQFSVTKRPFWRHTSKRDMSNNHFDPKPSIITACVPWYCNLSETPCKSLTFSCHYCNVYDDW